MSMTLINFLYTWQCGKATSLREHYKALMCRFQAANVIRLLISLVDSNTLRAFANARDLDGKTADGRRLTFA